MRKNIFLKIPTSCDHSIQIPSFCIITLQYSLNVQLESIVPVLYREVRAIDTTNVHFALKLVFGQGQSLLLLPVLALILKVMSVPNTSCSRHAVCETQSLSSSLGRASLLLLQLLSYSQGVQLHHKALYTIHPLSPSIAPSYTFLPSNNAHPALGKVIIKYSCLRNRHFIHRSAHTYHQVQ